MCYNALVMFQTKFGDRYDSSAKIELNQNDCDENVVELLNLAGIDVIISGKNASNDTSTSRASVNGIGFSEKLLIDL